MRPPVRRATAAALLLASLLAVVVFVTRLMAFLHIFFAHAGIPLTQPEVQLAHNSSTVDPRKQVVPKIIHQIFHNWTDPGNERMPEDWKKVRQTCIDLNPDYEFKLWTVDTSHSFIKMEYRELLSTYENYPYPVQKIDALRYLLMHKYGGIYIDLDNGCSANLDPLLYYPVWVTDGGHGALSNNILGAAPDHPFYDLVRSSLKSWAWSYPFPYITIVYASGQWFETVMWERYHAMFPQPENQLYRVMMDMRDGSSPWVFFNQGGRGRTWHHWDNNLFEGDLRHVLTYIAGLAIVIGIVMFVSLRVLRCALIARRKTRGYEKVTQGNGHLGRDEP